MESSGGAGGDEPAREETGIAGNLIFLLLLFTTYLLRTLFRVGSQNGLDYTGNIQRVRCPEDGQCPSQQTC